MADQPGDDDLFRAFQRGDRAAFEVLARRMEPSMLGLALGLLGGDSGRACDAVQNAWVRIIRAATTFQGQSSARTWMYRIVLNECRRMQSKSKHAGRQIEATTPGTTTERHCSEASAGAEENARVRAAVDELAAPAREAVLLCFHHGLTQALAAEVLEIPLGTLKTRVRAALQTMRSTLAMEIAP